MRKGQNMKRLFKIILSSSMSLILAYSTSAQAVNNTSYDREKDLIVFDDERTETPQSSEMKYKDIPVTDFRIENLSPQVETQLDYTEWWYSEWDDCRYIFLPSTANRNNLYISYSASDTVYLDGKAVKSDSYTSMLNEKDEFNISVGNVQYGKLKILQSEIGCIFMSVSNGSINYLDNNRYISEIGSAVMLDENGEIEYSGELEKITAHGNSSWDYSAKKPYNIKLQDKTNLYGLGKAKKWVLLSNYLDHSMLRNKITEEMCKAAESECVMDSVFVDLYADGSYRGTYQLSERVQIQKNRIDIHNLEEETEKLNKKDLNEYPQKVNGASDASQYIENSYKYYEIPNQPKDITGGYLLQFQQWNRYGYKSNSGFVTSRGQAVSIESPEYAAKEQVTYIRNFVQEMEDAIYSENGFNSKGKHYTEYLDIDSLVKAYLIQEISMNIDATYSSFFLWKDSDMLGDGKIHFSPAWDFDLSYNNFPTSRVNSEGKIGYSYKPNNLFAAYFSIHGYEDGGKTSSSGSGRNTYGISWIGQLYKTDEFKEKAAKIYFEDFEPFVSRLTDENKPYILELADRMRDSAEMNNIRWHTYGGAEYCVFGSSSGADFIESADIVRRFLKSRYLWLNSEWKQYYTVRGDTNSDREFDIADLVMLQKYILNIGDLTDWKAADLCKDNEINVFDLCVMKKELIYNY